MHSSIWRGLLFIAVVAIFQATLTILGWKMIGRVSWVGRNVSHTTTTKFSPEYEAGEAANMEMDKRGWPDKRGGRTGNNVHSMIRKVGIVDHGVVIIGAGIGRESGGGSEAPRGGGTIVGVDKATDVGLMPRTSVSQSLGKPDKKTTLAVLKDKMTIAGLSLQKTGHKTCPGTKYRQGAIDDVATWQKVTKSHFVLSAFYDEREDPDVVRVVGLRNNSAHDLAACLLFYPGQPLPVTVKPQVLVLLETTKFRFYSVMYTCELEEKKGKPCGVAMLYVNRTQNATTELPTGNTLLTQINHFLPIYRPARKKVRYTICLPPLFKYRNYFQFVEKIETARMFGANRLIVYVESTVGVLMKKYIELYEKLGIIEVIRWKVTLVLKLWDIHYHAQVASINDCFYRNRAETEYISFSDYDERIIPHTGNNWDDMIANIPRSTTHKTGGFMFMNRFYEPKCANIFVKGNITTETLLIDQAHTRLAQLFRIQSIMLRRADLFLWPPQTRCKMIYLSESLMTGGVHHPWGYGYRKGYGSVYSPEHVGILHHYSNSRTRPKEHTCENNTIYFTDRFFEKKFGAEIIERITKIHEAQWEM